MENRIDIDLLLELLDGTVEITTAKPEFCVFPLLGIPWELLSCSVSRMSRQSRKLIGAHLQVIETTVYHEVVLPYSIHSPTCFLFVQLRGAVGFQDDKGESIVKSAEPYISLCHYPSGDYFIKLRPGFHSLLIFSFDEDWSFYRTENYPAFAKLNEVWLAQSGHVYSLPPMPLSRSIINLFDEIRFIAGKYVQDDIRILQLLGKIVYAYHELLAAYQLTSEQTEENLLDLLDSYLEKHYMNEWESSIPVVKKALGLSRTSVEKLSKDKLGCTLQRYVIEFRIGKACILLLETKDKIRDIALRTGFSDLAHFTNCFKRSMGMDPSVYRKNNT